jgi:hypothetical protein
LMEVTANQEQRIRGLEAAEAAKSIAR